MANEEKSRDAFQPTKRYAAVGMQQGRVMLDDDFNENERIRLEEERRVNLDVIGPAGSPDGGFVLSSPRKGTSDGVDFDIGKGTFYLGGLRLWNPSVATFQQQDDWLQQASADRAGPVEGQVQLAFIEAWQQPVTATEDAELFEVALGGPDTSTRLRTMWRVQLASVDGSDCPTAWKDLVTGWTKLGYGTVDATGERVHDATLAVGYYQGQTGDLCTPAIGGGYLGAENQTIRVQMTSSSTFTWGFDNGAPIYRATSGGTSNDVITLGTYPRDQAHWPSPGQLVEILPYGARLPNDEKLAEPRGVFARVASTYDPDHHTFSITPGLDPAFGNAYLGRGDASDLGPLGYYVRVWDRGDDLSSADELGIGTDVQLGETGVQVTITGTSLVAGDHWVISARPKTPTTFVPWDLKTGRPPHGERHFFAPLALVKWHADGSFDLLHDCRPTFQPLTSQDGCCTYTVGDELVSVGRFSSIQDAVDALPKSGGKICVLPGRYPDAVTIDGFAQITIEGCGPRTIVAPERGTAFTITNSTHVTIQKLAIENLRGEGVKAIDGGDNPGDEIADLVLAELAISVRDASAIDVRNAARVAIARNQITVGALEKELGEGDRGRAGAVFASGEDLWIHENRVATATSTRYSRSPFGGIQIGGGSSRVELRKNHVVGGAGHAITLGSWTYVTQDVVDAVGDTGWKVFRKQFRYVPVGSWIFINDQGCVQIGWNPPPPDDGGDPLVPVSEGDLVDVRILDNELEGCAFSGISVARFFGEDNLQLITTDRLLIQGNRIHDNLQAANVEIDADMRDVAAFGAIALADGAYIVIRDNVIEGNGVSHVDPICGVFALRAEGIAIERNRIIDNAPRSNETSHAKAGLRGGIVLPRVTSPLWLAKHKPGIERYFRYSDVRRGYPSAFIHDNIVFVPLGRALHVIGDGAMSIADNELSSHGAIAPRYSPKGFGERMSGSGLMPSKYEEVMVGKSAPTTDIPAEYLEYKVGATTGPHKYSTRHLWTKGQPKTSGLLGSALQDGLDLIGAATVLVLDTGRSPSFELMQGNKVSNALFGLSDGGYLAASHVAIEGRSRLSGKVLFADNQVTLDLVGSEVEVLSSVLIASLDDIGLEDNQFEVLSSTSLVFIEVIAVAWTVRAIGNRINQTAPAARVTPVGLLSMLCYGVATQVTSNMANYCISATAINTNWLVFESNLELAAQNNHVEGCLIGKLVNRKIGVVIAEYLMSM
jgi:hypothetical protein